MVPDHEGMEPLDGSLSNYQLAVEPQSDGTIEVILDGGNFKGNNYFICVTIRFLIIYLISGFFLQVRAENGTDPEGTFEEHPKFRYNVH